MASWMSFSIIKASFAAFSSPLSTFIHNMLVRDGVMGAIGDSC